MLQKSEDQFRQSSESAYSIDSITLSQQSSATSQRCSCKNSSRGRLDHRPLSFENILFTSKVYIRASKNITIRQIHDFRERSKVKTRARPVPSLEAVQTELDARSLLLSSKDTPAEDEEIGYLLQPDKSPTPFFEQLLLGIAYYIVSARSVSTNIIQISD